MITTVLIALDRGMNVNSDRFTYIHDDPALKQTAYSNTPQAVGR
ncbi:hypothetical protein Tfer_0210 [Thermincola ferriacetica]|uniref:Uncharacterized protein n=1 Tax=Thermincola ferriacetica TaxID=281456 RepID=A0A0L6W6X9_9FIRM|nr:hypothetical protein [Thermincola ferriacetica]KNZ71133.1 hypothetical protein Tfer_0210 [Thermincola ferriacetica]